MESEETQLRYEIIHKLRDLAERNTSVIDMVKYLIEASNNDSVFNIMRYFRKSFFLKIDEIKPIGAWNYFSFYGSSWSDEEIEKEIKPFIDEQRWKFY